MPFDQYHEPPEELPAETRTFARMIASLIEEAEAIGWYEQRLAVEPDADARAIMENAQLEEFKHFAMDLEFLLRKHRGVAEGDCSACSSPTATSSRSARRRRRRPRTASSSRASRRRAARRSGRPARPCPGRA